MTDLPYQIAAVLRKSRNVLIACHVAPDGDCLGAALGLRLPLARIGVDAQVGSADGVPDGFLSLPGAADVMSAPPATRAEVAVAVECSTLDRAGSFAQALAEAKTLINIDHHLSNAGYGHLVYWDTAAAATGGQKGHGISAFRVPIDREIAECPLTPLG